MRKFLFFLWLSLSFVSLWGAEVKIDHVKVQGKGVENRECEIWYRVPKDYDANSKRLYRVLVYFGGRNFSGKTQMGYKDWHGWLDKNGIFLVSPSFKNENYWDPKGWSGRALLDGIAKIKKNYSNYAKTALELWEKHRVANDLDQSQLDWFNAAAKEFYKPEEPAK